MSYAFGLKPEDVTHHKSVWYVMSYPTPICVFCILFNRILFTFEFETEHAKLIELSEVVDIEKAKKYYHDRLEKIEQSMNKQ